MLTILGPHDVKCPPLSVSTNLATLINNYTTPCSTPIFFYPFHKSGFIFQLLFDFTINNVNTHKKGFF